MTMNLLSRHPVHAWCVSLLALVALPGLATAQTISSQKGLTTAVFAFTQPLEFEQFDPALGELESVSLAITGTFAIASYTSVDGFTFFGSVDGTGPSGLGDNTSALFNAGPQSSGTNLVLLLNQVNGSPSTIFTNLGPYVGLGTVDITISADYGAQPNGNEFFFLQAGPVDATVTLSYAYTPVPEPSGVALGCGAILGLLALRSRRKLVRRT